MPLNCLLIGALQFIDVEESSIEISIFYGGLFKQLQGNIKQSMISYENTHHF